MLRRPVVEDRPASDLDGDGGQHGRAPRPQAVDHDLAADLGRFANGR
jgi:hypothetical protein